MNTINTGTQTIRGKILSVDQNSIVISYLGSSYDRPGQNLAYPGEKIELTDLPASQLTSYQAGQVILAKGGLSANGRWYERIAAHDTKQDIKLEISAPAIRSNYFDPLGVDRMLTLLILSIVILAVGISLLIKNRLRKRKK